MSFMTPRRWAFSEMLRGLKRDGSRSLLSLLLAALALSIPLFIALVFYGLSEPLRSLPMSVELTVFAKDKAPMDKLESDVKAMPWVASTQIIPRDEALKGLNEKLGLPQRTGSNPLPDILIVTLSSDATSAEIEDVAKRIEALSSVDFVPYEASWHEKLQSVSRAVWTGLGCLGAVTALLVVLVLETAIRLTTLAAGSEMRTLYLLGATPIFAVRPYAWRGFVLMGAAAGLALLLVQAGLIVLSPALNDAAALYGGELRISLPPAVWCWGFAGISAFIGSLVAALAALSAWRGIIRESGR